MKTVAHLLPNYNPFPPVFPAGTELRVEQVSRRERRYRPVVVCGHFAGQAESETLGAMHVRRIRIGRVYRRVFQKLTRLDPVPYTARMWRIVQEEHAALVHIHNEPKLLSALGERLTTAGRPVVVHVANEKPIDPASIPLVARWLAASRYIAGWLEHKNGISPRKIKVVYTGVDLRAHAAWWQIAPAERARLRARFGVREPDARVILFAGRIVREKGVRELLDAFQSLRERHGEGVELLIAGNVRESDDPANEKAVYGKAAVQRMQGMPGVRYVGSLHPGEMRDFLAAGDVFALPSLWDDPFPTVMLEAAAAGLPIVAAARGGVTEFLEGCEAFDFVSRPEDPRQLAAALERYVLSRADAESAGRWLRRKIEGHFDWQRVADDFESVYDGLLGEGAR
ncbi:MAG TPA: glycosyltransferase family 4 protein [Burkholderiales bacterium]